MARDINTLDRTPTNQSTQTHIVTEKKARTSSAYEDISNASQGSTVTVTAPSPVPRSWGQGFVKNAGIFLKHFLKGVSGYTAYRVGYLKGQGDVRHRTGAALVKYSPDPQTPTPDAGQRTLFEARLVNVAEIAGTCLGFPLLLLFGVPLLHIIGRCNGKASRFTRTGPLNEAELNWARQTYGGIEECDKAAQEDLAWKLLEQDGVQSVEDAMHLATDEGDIDSNTGRMLSIRTFRAFRKFVFTRPQDRADYEFRLALNLLSRRCFHKGDQWFQSEDFRRDLMFINDTYCEPKSGQQAAAGREDFLRAFHTHLNGIHAGTQVDRYFALEAVQERTGNQIREYFEPDDQSAVESTGESTRGDPPRAHPDHASYGVMPQLPFSES